MSKGVSYGYAYAPSATQGQEVLPSPGAVVAVTALGDGWWWVDTA